jgi:hypothetical protein
MTKARFDQRGFPFLSITSIRVLLYIVRLNKNSERRNIRGQRVKNIY